MSRTRRKKIFLTTINNEEELCILKTVKRKKEKKSLNAKSFPIIFLLLGSFSTRFCLSNRAAAARGRFSLCESIKHTQTAGRKARDEFYVKKRTKPSRTKHYIFNVIWIFIELLKVLGCYQREKRHKMSKKASKRFFIKPTNTHSQDYETRVKWARINESGYITWVFY
jgi:hypothetical protein